MKRPSFQFYPSDWLTDTALRCCSIGARGLWIDMICYMHEGSPYGYLKVNHKVIHKANLARMAGLSLDEVDGYISELVDSGVCQVDEDGCFFSKRMVRDENLRLVRAAGGKKGGNPALIGKKKSDERLTSEVKQNPTPSSSSSSSLVTDVTKKRGTRSRDPDAPLIISAEMMVEVPLMLARKFIAHRKQKGDKSGMTEEAWALHLRESAKAGITPAAAIDYAIAKTWKAFTASYYLNAERTTAGASNENHQSTDKSAVGRTRSDCERWAAEQEAIGREYEQVRVFDGELEPNSLYPALAAHG